MALWSTREPISFVGGWGPWKATRGGPESPGTSRLALSRFGPCPCQHAVLLDVAGDKAGPGRSNPLHPLGRASAAAPLVTKLHVDWSEES